MSTGLRRAVRLLRLAIHLVWGTAQALVIGLLLRVAPASGRRLRRARVSRWLARAAAILGVRVTVEGTAASGAALFVANHISWLDILVLARCCDGDFVAKAEVRRWPLIGWLAAVAGTVFVARGRAASQQTAARSIEARLKAGGRVVLFPEGTTTVGGIPGLFRRRFFQPAIVAGVPVQPVAISYRVADAPPGARVAFVGDDSIHSHCWRMLAIREIHVHLHYLAPEAVAARHPRELAEACRLRVVAALEETPHDQGRPDCEPVTGLSCWPSRLI